MKYLKYLLVIVIVLLLAFFAKGLFTPSIYYESEVIVNKPAKEVWAVMSDESKLPEWIKGFKKIELISGTANSVGAISKIYVEDRGEEMIMEETVTNIKPNELLAMTFTMDFMDMDYEMSLEENDGKTLIKTKSKTAGNGMFAKSMVSFMKSSMKLQEDENLNNLKIIIEENTKNYFPEPTAEVTDEIEK